jgi:cytochrome c peroxidase
MIGKQCLPVTEAAKVLPRRCIVEVAMSEKFAIGIASKLFIAMIAGTVLPASSATPVRTEDPFRTPPPLIVPADNQMTPARIALGKTLFFDPRLSGSKWISCATCHNPALGWSDGLSTAMGNGMVKLRRASPTLINAAYASIFMWDGRKATLEEQALGPFQSKDEMDMDMSVMLDRISAISGYRDMFRSAYPGERISPELVAKALASFERTIVSKNTPFDRWRQGETAAVSPSAKRGFELFRTTAKCSACHQGYNFSDDGFHNIGLKTPAGMAVDEGRYGQRKVKSMVGAFKTPTLREVALTAPYMHNGVYLTLEEVVEHYDRGGDTKENLDPNMTPLQLTARDKADLVEFMKSLTSRPAAVVLPRLPQ